MDELNYYEGQTKNGRLHGKGKVSSPNGIVLEGSFKDGLPEGEVEARYPDGRIYSLLINDGKLIKKELIKGKEPVKEPPLNPYRPKPGKNPKSKSGGFIFKGLDLDIE